jgi:hypothetical protein
MDHVEAEYIARDKSGVVLKITNPTKYDARVSILAEKDSDSKIPLPDNAFETWPVVEIKAGQTRTISLTTGGQIKPSKEAHR